MNNIVSLEYLNDYDVNALKLAVNSGLERLNIRQALKPKMKVLIKICMPDAVSQDLAETTNPAVVRAVIDCLNDIGVSCIVADSPYKKNNLTYLNTVYLNTGMLEMANLTKGELNHDLSVCKIPVPNGVMTK